MPIAHVQMKAAPESQAQRQVQQQQNLAAQPQEAIAGQSFSPPPFQLQASTSLKDAVSPVQRLALGLPPIQRVALVDYADNDVAHDPSNVPEAWIRSTTEFAEFSSTFNVDPETGAPLTRYADATIVLACRLMLRAMREGNNVIVAKHGQAFLNRAKMQSAATATAEAMTDNLQWQGTRPGRNNSQFGEWLLNGGPEPSQRDGEMNCWEFVMFSAYRAGYATFGGLRAIYLKFSAELAEYKVFSNYAVKNVENALRRGNEYVYDPINPAKSPKPLRGDIVIFNTLGNHTAVATGNYRAGRVEIMSLWTQNASYATRTTVEALLADGGIGPVRFFSPNWH